MKPAPPVTRTRIATGYRLSRRHLGGFRHHPQVRRPRPPKRSTVIVWIVVLAARPRRHGRLRPDQARRVRPFALRAGELDPEGGRLVVARNDVRGAADHDGRARGRRPGQRHRLRRLRAVRQQARSVREHALRLSAHSPGAEAPLRHLARRAAEAARRQLRQDDDPRRSGRCRAWRGHPLHGRTWRSRPSAGPTRSAGRSRASGRSTALPSSSRRRPASTRSTTASRSRIRSPRSPSASPSSRSSRGSRSSGSASGTPAGA